MSRPMKGSLSSIRSFERPVLLSRRSKKILRTGTSRGLPEEGPGWRINRMAKQHVGIRRMKVGSRKIHPTLDVSCMTSVESSLCDSQVRRCLAGHGLPRLGSDGLPREAMVQEPADDGNPESRWGEQVRSPSGD